MSEKCKICALECNVGKEGLKCVECATVVHLQCVPGDVSKKGTLRKHWKCDTCKSETLSTGSRSGERDPVLEAIAAFRREFNSRSDETQAAIEKVQADMNSVRLDVSELKNQYKEVRVMCDNNSEEVQKVRAENANLIVQVNTLKSELSDLQQHTRKNNILITGVPLTPRENVYELLLSIANLIDVRYNRYDVSVAHRLPSKKNDTRPPSIVVSFLSRSVKADWIHARRQRRHLSAREIVSTFPDQQVFINDHLTPETRALFNEARSMMKGSKLAAVWTDDGRVLAKKTVTGRPFRVLRVEDLRQMVSSSATQPLQQRESPTSGTEDTISTPTTASV